MSMLEIICPDCQKRYTVDLQGKDGQRFRCGVCSCYFYVTCELVAKVAERDTYTQTERKVVCPHCGEMILHPLDNPMGCYACSCGEIYHLRKLKHSVPEADMPLPPADTIAVGVDMTAAAFSEDMVDVSEDTVPLPDVTASSPTEQFVKVGSGQRIKKVIRFGVDEETASHTPFPLDTGSDFAEDDPVETCQEKHHKSGGLCSKLAALCRPGSK